MGKSIAQARIGRGHASRRSARARVIPYAASIGVRVSRPQDLVQQVEAGFSYTAFEKLLRLLLKSGQELAKLLDIPARTLTRRKQAGRFSAKESERLLRLSKLLEASAELFEGDREGAVAWLGSPNRALGGETPLALSKTEIGAREVENLIGRLEHGVFS